jgi:hypothetical protein
MYEDKISWIAQTALSPTYLGVKIYKKFLIGQMKVMPLYLFSLLNINEIKLFHIY